MSDFSVNKSGPTHELTDSMKQFLTGSMCGYLSGPVTEASVSLMSRYWSTEWMVPQMERSFFTSTRTSWRNFLFRLL